MKFTPTGGEIKLKMLMEVSETERTLFFEVIDTGAGMEEEKIQEILSGNSKSTLGSNGEKGYGFGLNLVLHLVNSLNGEMEIESKKGIGSNFKITIPLK